MLRIALVFGGRSAEHEISLLSAYNVLAALTKSDQTMEKDAKDANAGINEKSKYEVVAIGITRQGNWLLADNWQSLLITKGALPAVLSEDLGPRLALVPGHPGFFYNLESHQAIEVDLIFPVLHGPYGEDGSLQGLVKQLGLPIVGNNVLSSAIAMDKDIMKRLLLQSQIPVADYLVFQDHEQDKADFKNICCKIGLPFYIKPANQGSSVGIHRISQANEFLPALQDAFSYDHKVLVEQNITGREIECAVLGNETYEASLVGEVVTEDGFYSYQAKYMKGSNVRLDMPAKLSLQEQQYAQQVALKTAKILGLQGMARVDMFLESKGRIIVNEVNTIPGFTGISMYPGLWKKSGLSLLALLDRLLALALEREEKQKKILQPFPKP